MQKKDRRNFLQHAAITAGCLAGGRSALAAQADETNIGSAAPVRRQPIAVSTYSFWRFQDGKRMPIEKCIDVASEMGFDALEVLHVQMHQTDNAYLQKLKRQALQKQ